MLFDDMVPKIEPEPGLIRSTPQMIFNERHDDVVMIRKQDNRFGIDRDGEIMLALEQFADWQLKSGIGPEELEQARDIVRRERLEIEGR